MSPSERTHNAKMAGLQRAANDPTNAGAERARDALEASWIRKAQERFPLANPAEQRAVATTLRKLHYQKMSRAGVRARQARAAR